MTDTLQKFKQVDYELPKKIQAWHLYGAGLENFGKDGKPIEVPMLKYRDDELLLRMDAVGICFSDIKVINQGNQHPRTHGRDMVNDPVILGHEAAVTVAGVGSELKDKYKVGQRFIIQPDVFFGGKSMAFGYALPGAQTQYQVVGKQVLSGDDGCYLLPVKDSTGYAEAALTEPWACVVASYRISRRTQIHEGGVTWMLGNPDDDDYTLGMEINPKVVLATGMTGRIRTELETAANMHNFQIIDTPTLENISIEELASIHGGFDDVIILSPNAEILETASEFLNKYGIIAVMGEHPLPRTIKIDIGKIHYMNHSFLGSKGRNIYNAYKPIRLPSELNAGGISWFIGAGGPMGQMHVQRAVEMPDPPSKILATDIDTERLKSVRQRYTSIAERRGIELQVINPKTMNTDEFNNLLNEFSVGNGFDDIVVLAPVAPLVEHAAGFLGTEGLMNIFAGVPIGTIARIDMSGIYTRQCRFMGSSGSKITDLQDTLSATESGELSTNTSVAAIGGIEAAWEGMKSVKEGLFPGRVVIYPLVRDLELTGISDLKVKLPNVYAKLTDGMFWNREAEAELIRTMVKFD